MNCNNPVVPSIGKRIYSIWYRHVRVYSTSLFSNAFPPFFEPLIFLAGLGIGIGSYIQTMGAMNYIVFLASGLIITSAMYSASFECTYGTYIRLEFDRVYDGMLGSPISPKDMVLGELLFTGTKGAFFSFAVLSVVWIFGIITYPLSLFAILVGFIAGVMFGAFSMFVTSYVRNINHFNFYFTGLISPMFFFSGVIFPLEHLPRILSVISEIIPLTHVVRLARALCVPELMNSAILFDVVYCLLFCVVFVTLAVVRISKRILV